MLRDDLMELLGYGSRRGLHMHLNTDGFRVDSAAPNFAGLLVDWYGVAPAFLLNGLSFLPVILALLAMWLFSRWEGKAFSVIGIPPFGGFFGKFYIFMAGMEALTGIVMITWSAALRPPLLPPMPSATTNSSCGSKIPK